ncbi:MAG: CoA transferase [Xanthomonadales bacterium]|nr:CoA transferase [Xanthomonadales bacterium]
MHELLRGIRVLDFGRYVAGPYCATLLGYLGAEVIRVEKAEGGEDRFIAPFGDSGTGGLFMQTGCNKRSLALDFRRPGSAEAVRRLVKTADVVVANLPPKALQRLGLDWETVHALNPGIILSTQTAFGSEGPLADRGGFDGVAQAMSGAMFMTGTPGKPVKAAAPYVDFSTAVLSALGVMAALYARRETGLGQHVEASLLATAMAVFGSHLAEQGALRPDREPTGNRVQTSGPSDVFATRDGHVLTHVVGNGLFKRCAELLGRPEWVGAPGLDSDQGRGDARDELCEAMADWCAQRTTEAALEALQGAGIPAGPVLNLQEALDLPQAAAMGMFRRLGFPGWDGEAPVVDLPLRFSDGAAGIRSEPPALGADSEQILEDLGFEPEEIRALLD